METNDDYVPEDQFTSFLEAMPQVCVEVVLKTSEGVLVSKRTNKPRLWFWPGSRLYKGESLTDAAHRVAGEELGIDIKIHDQLGVQEHFWDADQTEKAVHRHTVNIVYLAAPASAEYEIELDDQHSTYRFLTDLEPDLHEYVTEYLTAYGLVGTESEEH